LFFSFIMPLFLMHDRSIYSYYFWQIDTIPQHNVLYSNQNIFIYIYINWKEKQKYSNNGWPDEYPHRHKSHETTYWDIGRNWRISSSWFWTGTGQQQNATICTCRVDHFLKMEFIIETDLYRTRVMFEVVQYYLCSTHATKMMRVLLRQTKKGRSTQQVYMDRMIPPNCKATK
jgi:hypothetical protein